MPDPICESRRGACDIDEEAVKPDPYSFWMGNSRMVGAGLGDESTECGSNVQIFRTPSVIRP